jgi:hypothetical protein
MQTEDIQVLVDLGVLNPRADELSAYTVWGLLLKDPIVWQRKLALPRDPKYPAMIPTGAVHTVVAAMTAKEKEELRDRILDKCENRKPA